LAYYLKTIKTANIPILRLFIRNQIDYILGILLIAVSDVAALISFSIAIFAGIKMILSAFSLHDLFGLGYGKSLSAGFMIFDFRHILNIKNRFFDPRSLKQRFVFEKKRLFYYSNISKKFIDAATSRKK
jgi:hypothetical protein